MRFNGSASSASVTRFSAADIPLHAFDSNGQINLSELRTNTTLRKDEWKQIDETVLDVARQRLNGVADLQAAGLVHTINDIGTTISEYERQTDLTDANVDMMGVTQGEEDRLTFDLIGIPIPLVYKDFRLNLRTLSASRSRGSNIDTLTASVASRKVSDKLESILFNGDTGITLNSAVLQGYTTHDDRNTGSGSDWGTITNIYPDVNSMISDAETDNYYGPYWLYVAKTQFGQMRAIHTDGSGESAFERVRRGLVALQAVKPADVLTDGSAVLVQASREVVDLAVALNISTVQWETQGGFLNHFRVWAVMAPRIKSDSNSASGVVHYTGL